MKDAKFELSPNAGYVLLLIGVLLLGCAFYGLAHTDSNCATAMARGFKEYCADDYGRGIFALTSNFIMSIFCLIGGFFIFKMIKK